MEIYLHRIRTHRYPSRYGFNDSSLLGRSEVRPSGMEMAGISYHSLMREVVDAQSVEGGLGGGEFLLQGGRALLEGAVAGAEPVLVELVVDVELVHLVHVALHTLGFAGKVRDPLLPLPKGRVGRFPVLRYLLVREEIAFELFVVDGFEVGDGNAVVARPTAVAGIVRGDIHLRAAMAESEAGEEMHGPAADVRFGPALVRQKRVRFLPHFGRDDGFDFPDDPLALGLGDDPPVHPAGNVQLVHALRALVLHHPEDSLSGELLAG